MAKKLKIVQVLPSLAGGGVERGTLECSAAIVAAGHESHVISAGGPMVAELEAAGGNHTCWDLGRKSPATLLQVFKLASWLREQGPDILHVRSRMPAWICYLAWLYLPITSRPHLVTTLHGLHSVNRYSSIMSKGERVIVVSRTARDYLTQNYHVNEQNIRLIYRGISPAVFPRGYAATSDWQQHWFERYPQLKGKFVLCLPGRITRLKGHHDFIDLIAYLRQQHPQVAGLVVGGEDPKRQSYARELHQRVDSLGLSSDITFTGARQDILDVYSVSDAVLSLSTQPESFGRTVLEALSIGKPVYGYNHGGVAEILEALFPNGAVPLGDWHQMATRLVNRISGEDQSTPAQNDRFLLEQMTNATLAVYEELTA